MGRITPPTAAGTSDATKLSRDYSMPSADAATPPVIKITQANAVDDNSAELMQVFLSTIKSFWMNEGGNPRSESYDFDQVPLKLFGRRASGTQTANLFEVFSGGASSALTWAILPSGYVSGQGQVRFVGSSAPSTTGWVANQLWLDTSTEV